MKVESAGLAKHLGSNSWAEQQALLWIRGKMQERKDHSLMGHADVCYHQSLLGTSSRLAWTYVG
jgi:hypothetical protein